MVGLLDIAPLTKTVEVRGTPIVVTGITGEGLFHLFQNFPKIAAALSERGEVTGDQLMRLAPDLVAQIIAAGTGNPGHPEAIAIAKTLSAQEQLELIEATLELTFPKGVGPFVETLMRLASQVDVGEDTGWDRVTKSLGQSKNSLRSGTRRPTSGATPQDSSKDGSNSPAGEGLPSEL